MATDSKIYWRRFLRTGGGGFEDFPADKKFADANFLDFFGKTWLPAHPNALSLDDVLRPFYDESEKPDSNTFFQVFAVSDGSVIQSTTENEAWLNQSIRFVAFIAGNDQNIQAQPFDANSWTLCVVGSDFVTDNEIFLQVASWDGKRFRYYGREHANGTGPLAWIFQGDSTYAFGDQSYMGPFNGHVNGSLVMKEMHRPWIHWLVAGNGFTNNISNQILAQFSNFPYLTDPNGSLSNVQGADSMESYIKSGINRWFSSRRQMDFVDEKLNPRVEVKNVKRWLAHVLLTTTVNITSALQNTQPAQHVDFDFPSEHFYNSDLFGLPAATAIQPSDDLSPLGFKSDPYGTAVDALKLALVQVYPPEGSPQPDPTRHPEVDKVIIGNEEVRMFVVEYGEGQNLAFTVLQPSYEDVQAASILLTMKTPLLSKNCLYAMLMVDPWNPVYSWKRGVLMQYVPDTTHLPGPFDPKANPPQKYDLEAKIEAAVRDSPRFKNEPDSPEREFIANLEEQRQGSSKFSDRMTDYLTKVGGRLGDPNQVNAAMIDFMTLAESRRRIYRPVPLDEFDLTLPWATNYNHESPFEMKKDGTIAAIAPRGVKFFRDWIGSLASSNPQMMPRPDKDDPDDHIKDPTLLKQTALAARTAAISCQSSSTLRNIRRGKCPVLSSRKRAVCRSGPSFTQSAKPNSPTWDHNINALFTMPYWIEPLEKRIQVGKHWVGAMKHFGAPIPPWKADAEPLGLDNYDQVKLQAVTIYQHVASRSMPITSDPAEYWPEDALELLRAWINQGCRKTESDTISAPAIPLEAFKTPIFRTRKDIRDLTPTELSQYRAKLRDVLGIASVNSKWQELGELHAWWCLHYQEATFFWHRCYLRYVEELIDFPIPYWNGFATDAANPDSPYAGIPEIFLEDTYIAPDGTTHKNPLRWAYSYQGKSKSNPETPYVQRNPILVKGRPSQPGPYREAWNKQINLFNLYHQQIVTSMQQSVFSLPQYNPAPNVSAEAAWAALPAFLQDMPDSDYTVAYGTFDGHFEQAHDNFHGWIGGAVGEMADNTYTAFDPIFLSYHCNMDRLFEHYLRSNPGTKVTAEFPLRPFVEHAKGLDFVNPNSWAYTTTGDVAKPTAALGYIYAPPASPDIFELPKPTSKVAKASGGVALNLIRAPRTQNLSSVSVLQDCKTAKLKPVIIFEQVGCTEASYEIDIFLTGAKSQLPDPVKNPDFVGRLFRMGMGKPPAGVELKNRSRCLKETVTRVIDAEAVAGRIKETGWFQKVKELDGSDEVIPMPEQEWKAKKGFEGKLLWVVR